MFQFRLAPVLRLREATEEQRKQALAQALGERDALRERLAVVERERHRCHQRLIQEGAGIDFGERRLFGAYLDRLAGEAAAIAKEMDTAQSVVERRRRELADASRDRQVLERLRERRFTAYQKAEIRREQRTLDELAVIGFGRRRAEEEETECRSTL